MNMIDLFANLIDYARHEGFGFLAPDEKLEDPKKLSASQQAFMQIASGIIYAATTGLGAVGGIMGAASSGPLSRVDKKELVPDLKKMNEYCDFSAIDLNSVFVMLRLALDGDSLTNDAIVERSDLIHQKSHDFHKYAMFLFGHKSSVHADMMIAFSSHHRAKEFVDSFAKKCNKKSFWKAVFTHPWVVDLENEEITGFQIDIGSLMKKNLQSVLFRKRQ